jgi:hypothetical protein
LLAQARGVTRRVPVGDATPAVRVGPNGIVKVSLRTRSQASASQGNASLATLAHLRQRALALICIRNVVLALLQIEGREIIA